MTLAASKIDSENHGKKPKSEVPRTQRIMVVDDDEHTRELLKLLLENEHTNVVLCSNSSEAITEFRRKLPDLALLDVRMPGGMDGYKLCEKLKEMSKDIFLPIILLTGNTQIEQKIIGLNAGANDYITKPFDSQELRARVSAHLRTKFLTDKLNETQGKLRAKEKELLATQITGGAAHSLGQPLTSILLHCELIENVDQKTDEFKESLSEIKNQCKRIKSILDTLSKSTTVKTMKYTGNLEVADFSGKKKNNS